MAPSDRRRHEIGVAMIKSELIQKIAEENPHLFQRDVERIVGTVFEEIIEAIGVVAACAGEGEGVGEAAAAEEEEEVHEAASTSAYHADHHPPYATRDTSMRMPTQQSESRDHKIALVGEARRRTQRHVLPSEALHVDDCRGALLPYGIGR